MAAARRRFERGCLLPASGDHRPYALSSHGDPAIALDETGPQERFEPWRAANRLAVDAADEQLAPASVGKQAAEGLERGGRDVSVVERGQRLERGAATVHVQRRKAVDQDDVRPGRALEWSLVGVTTTRPRDRGAVWVGRIRRREQVHV